MWKSIWDQRSLIERALKWILGNDKSIDFWQYVWLYDYPLIRKVLPDKLIKINQTAKVSEFISEVKWKLNVFRDYLPRLSFKKLIILIFLSIIVKIRLARILLLQVTSLLNQLPRQTTLDIKNH